ncbi:MAG TPA: lmo0937 family membrane protein [Myxococcaceae bacterium]|nr:lmo0937 family membrane protein [Myxococcaceae bacterium]
MGNLLWVLAIVFVALWVLGLVANVTFGGLIHVLLVLAVIAVLFRIISGRRIA